MSGSGRRQAFEARPRLRVIIFAVLFAFATLLAAFAARPAPAHPSSNDSVICYGVEGCYINYTSYQTTFPSWEAQSVNAWPQYPVDARATAYRYATVTYDTYNDPGGAVGHYINYSSAPDVIEANTPVLSGYSLQAQLSNGTHEMGHALRNADNSYGGSVMYYVLLRSGAPCCPSAHDKGDYNNTW